MAPIAVFRPLDTVKLVMSSRVAKEYTTTVQPRDTAENFASKDALSISPG